MSASPAKASISSQADQKEAFNIGLDLPASDPEVIAGKPFRGVNLWPQTPGFRDTALDYFNALWRLGLDLHLAIATDLGLPPSFFADKFDRPMATLRLLHYPPRDAGNDDLPGAGEHTDYGSLTILLTDNVGGLEVRRRDGAWIEAPPIPGAFVCNIGDCLMRWSNDTYVSTPHRVTSPAGPRPLFDRVLLRSQSGCIDRMPAGLQRAGPAAEISRRSWPRIICASGWSRPTVQADPTST